MFFWLLDRQEISVMLTNEPWGSQSFLTFDHDQDHVFWTKHVKVENHKNVFLTFEPGSNRYFFDLWSWLIDLSLAFEHDSSRFCWILVLMFFWPDANIQANSFYFTWPSLQSRELEVYYIYIRRFPVKQTFSMQQN
jgi:hypothetical protein